jgi:peptidylprolyl isomerase/peptidyl-prolyl cis-trans isomerase B (cyclophilin B)
VVDVGDDAEISYVALVHGLWSGDEKGGYYTSQFPAAATAAKVIYLEETMPKSLALAALLAVLASTPALRADQTPVSGTATTQNAPKTKAPKAVIELAKGGKIVFKFYPDGAPKTVENFISLAKKGFYDGLTFHRVEPGFVVQGGDPNGNGSGGPGYTIKAEFNDHPHVRGTVAMARTNDPDSAGSQFYICLGTASFLDHKYTVFGQVIEGDSLLDGIRVGDKMKSVKIVY